MRCILIKTVTIFLCLFNVSYAADKNSIPISFQNNTSFAVESITISFDDSDITESSKTIALNSAMNSSTVNFIEALSFVAPDINISLNGSNAYVGSVHMNVSGESEWKLVLQETNNTSVTVQLISADNSQTEFNFQYTPFTLYFDGELPSNDQISSMTNNTNIVSYSELSETFNPQNGVNISYQSLSANSLQLFMPSNTDAYTYKSPNIFPFSTTFGFGLYDTMYDGTIAETNKTTNDALGTAWLSDTQVFKHGEISKITSQVEFPILYVPYGDGNSNYATCRDVSFILSVSALEDLNWKNTVIGESLSIIKSGAKNIATMVVEGVSAFDPVSLGIIAVEIAIVAAVDAIDASLDTHNYFFVAAPNLVLHIINIPISSTGSTFAYSTPAAIIQCEGANSENVSVYFVPDYSTVGASKLICEPQTTVVNSLRVGVLGPDGSSKQSSNTGCNTGGPINACYKNKCSYCNSYEGAGREYINAHKFTPQFASCIDDW